MGLHNLFDDGQSGACTWILLSCVQASKNFENPPNMLGRNADAVIVHGKAIVARLLCRAKRNLRPLASSHEFEGVTQEITKDLGQAHFWIAHYGQGLRDMNAGPRIGDFDLQVM